MSRKYNINNIEELHAKVHSLKAQNKIQGEALVVDAKQYLQQYSPGNLIKKYATPSNFLKADEQLNISGKVMSLALPLLMNNTIFRGSGFITKALVGLASGKVGQSLDAEHLTGLFTKVKSWFGGKKKKQKLIQAPRSVDYGIPPSSQTL
ncbi:MAG: hypothetical protein EOO89_05150 [Pedobacter sp.]|nr:MAG: hypothetical protein EOO89_05150 [Pedobacter sp.]